MKVLLVQFESIGGVQLYTARLANELCQTHEVHFLVGRRLMNQDYYSDKIKFHPISSPQSYASMFFLSLNPLTYLNIIKTIHQINPDVIHIATPFLWIALVLPFLRRYPLVVTEHDPALHAGTSLLVKSYMRPSIWITRKFADAIIVHGKKLKQIVVAAGVQEKKVWVTRHGEFSYYSKWAHQDISANKSVLYFGSIREYKGLQYLINAAPTIIAQAPGTNIIIAGDGDINKYFQSGQQRECFEIHNRYIPDAEVAELFQKCSVVVLPYTDGSQSGVIPIAYSFGKPVVVTDVGSIAESVEEGRTGFIIPPRDSQSLANAVIRIINDDVLRDTMGKYALQKTQNELSWKNIARDTIGIYQESIKIHKNQKV